MAAREDAALNHRSIKEVEWWRGEDRPPVMTCGGGARETFTGVSEKIVEGNISQTATVVKLIGIIKLFIILLYIIYKHKNS